jgi:Fe-S-cluster containining protein
MFLVAFHWSEADASQGGTVPPGLGETLDPHRLMMRGTRSSRPRCVALRGEIGTEAFCSIYERRPTPCRELQPAWENGEPSPQCDRARRAHGLPALTPGDWIAFHSGSECAVHA